MLEAEWWQVCGEARVWGKKEDESSTGWVQAAGFHSVMARSCLAHIFMNCFISLILQIFFFWGGGRGQPWITETADMAVHLY